MDYHGKFGHTLGRIQHIALMIRIDLCYATFRLANQTVAPNLLGLQGTKLYVQYLASHPHKPIFILLIIMMDKMLSDLHGVGIKLNTKQPRIVFNLIKMWIMS